MKYLPSIHRHLVPVIGVLAAAVWLNGCAWLIKPPVDEAAARRLVDAAAGINAGLDRYKGLARARVQSRGQTISGRVAVAAAAPDRLRVEWLSALGQPITGLAGNGETITVVSYPEKKIYRLPQTRTALERMVHIPMGIGELTTILAGRPPLPRFAAAQIDPDHTPTYRVLLKNRWRAIVASLELERTSGRIVGMRSNDDTGNMRFTIQWHRWKTQGGYTVPGQVLIRSASQHTLTLTMDRFWPNAEVSPEMFELSLPDQPTDAASGDH